MWPYYQCCCILTHTSSSPDCRRERAGSVATSNRPLCGKFEFSVEVLVHLAYLGVSRGASPTRHRRIRKVIKCNEDVSEAVDVVIVLLPRLLGRILLSKVRPLWLPAILWKILSQLRHCHRVTKDV